MEYFFWAFVVVGFMTRRVTGGDRKGDQEKGGEEEGECL